MSQARRATKAQPQVAQQQQQAYPQPQHPAQYPQQQGYPEAQYPQQQSGYPQAQYPQQQSGYPQAQYPQQSGYPQAQYPQQQYSQPQQSAYPQPQYAQQQQSGYPQHPQQQYPQQAQYPEQSGYPAQQQYAQQPSAYPAPQQQYPQAQYAQHSDPAILESGVHPADLDGRTIVRPSFAARPSPAPVGNALHNDTVIAISPFADPFAAARLQAKSDPPHASALAETKVQTMDAATFAASAPSPQPAIVGHPGHMAYAATAVQPQYHLAGTAPAAAAAGQTSNRGASPMPRTSNAPANTAVAASSASSASAGPGLRLGIGIGIGGVGGSVDLGKLDKFAGRFGKGMVPVMGLAAVVIALVFDVIFLKFPFGGGGGFIGKLWYLTTAVSFAAAGYGAAVTTRAKKGFVFTVAVVVALIYGAGDLALESVLEGIPVTSALILAIQGVVIALVCGIGAAIKGFKQRA